MSGVTARFSKQTQVHANALKTFSPDMVIGVACKVFMLQCHLVTRLFNY